MAGSNKRKFYAVAVGHQPGVYDTWPECQIQVNGFRGQKFKSFATREEAEEFVLAKQSPGTSGSTRGLENLSLSGPPSIVAGGMRGTNTLGVIGTSSSVVGRPEGGMRNPFKTYAHRTSSSVLEMEPADYEKTCADPRSTDVAVAQVTEADLNRRPSHLHTDRASESDVDALCQLEYDGASKGNPGKAGAGALLRHPDGTVLFEVSVGLGKATNNVAEYRGLIAGLRKALEFGIDRIQVQGNSQLVTMQVRGVWKIKHEHLAVLCTEATGLLKNFKDFRIRNVDKEYNAAADLLANKGVGLPEEKFVSSFTA